eukprot:1775521-Prymnesium_polylepis.1
MQQEYNKISSQLRKGRRSSIDLAKLDEFKELHGNSIAAMGNRAVLAQVSEKRSEDQLKIVRGMCIALAPGIYKSLPAHKQRDFARA